MKAILHDALFASGASSLSLLALFEAAFEGRHRVELREEDGPCFGRWLDAQGMARDDILFALDASREEESRAPSKRVVSVHASAASDWTARPPALTLTDARSLLALPFWVLPENWKTDYAFLLVAATPDQRNELERRRARGWLDVQNGGGLSDMCNRLQDIKRNHAARCLAVWVLFDSDARVPGRPSPQSKALHGTCGRRIPSHQLTRRTIESYIPPRALKAWATKKRDTRLAHRVEAFHEMPSDEQRHHYPMKGGLDADEKGEEGVNEALYGPPALTPELRRRLKQGFGSDLRDVFSDQDIGITTSDLLQDKSFGELNSAVTELLGWMR